MSLAKTKKQVVDYATVNIQLREALQALFDECVIADALGELSEAVTGETLDKVREALKAAEQSVQADVAERAATLSGLYNCQVCGEEKCRQPGICAECLITPTEDEVKNEKTIQVTIKIVAKNLYAAAKLTGVAFESMEEGSLAGNIGGKIGECFYSIDLLDSTAQIDN